MTLLSLLLILSISTIVSPSLAIEIVADSNSNDGYSLTSNSLGYDRKSPPLPLGGTKNWERLEPDGPTTFSPRHSHATCVFRCPHDAEKDCLWLTGGRTEKYRTWNLQLDDRTADVWWSEKGRTWNKVVELTGDFLDLIGNFDAKYGGEVAPWFGRYGHSLNAMDTNDDGIDDVMVLFGGHDPVASNDVWISPNGTAWYFAGHAPFPGRAYHATAVFKR